MKKGDAQHPSLRGKTKERRREGGRQDLQSFQSENMASPCFCLKKTFDKKKKKYDQIGGKEEKAGRAAGTLRQRDSLRKENSPSLKRDRQRGGGKRKMLPLKTKEKAASKRILAWESALLSSGLRETGKGESWDWVKKGKTRVETVLLIFVGGGKR